jgi:hypothetical protein
MAAAFLLPIFFRLRTRHRQSMTDRASLTSATRTAPLLPAVPAVPHFVTLTTTLTNIFI